MPFTAAHPAIVLPLVKLRSRWFSTTGLVTGSIAPDFEYFIRLSATSEVSHTLPGVFLFNLPAALLLATVFHVMVRDELVIYMPAFLQQRVLTVGRLNWLAYLRKNWHVFAISVMIGAGSHIFWDGFTYYGGYFVQQWPSIFAQTVTLWGRPTCLCRIIQHASTIIGSIIIGLVVLRRKPNPAIQTASPLQKVFFWFSIPVLAAGFVLLYLGENLSSSYIRNLLITYLTSLLLSTVFVSYSLKKLRTERFRG